MTENVRYIEPGTETLADHVMNVASLAAAVASAEAEIDAFGLQGGPIFDHADEARAMMVEEVQEIIPFLVYAAHKMRTRDMAHFQVEAGIGQMMSDGEDG